VPLILAPEKQDELVAFTSHLPYLLASALMKTVLSREDPQLWQVAASGFRDTSRLAASDIAMMLDILLTNRQAILSALGDYQAELNKLTAFLQDADEDALQGFLTPVQQKRSLMFRSVS
jgi:prephenate dehydrogenase